MENLPAKATRSCGGICGGLLDEAVPSLPLSPGSGGAIDMTFVWFCPYPSAARAGCRASILAAKMKSFSCRPSILWVQSWILTLP